MEQQGVLKTFLPLAYKINGKLEIASTLDISKKCGLFGVCIGNFILSLKQYEELSWLDCYWLIEQNKDGVKTPRLPDEEDFYQIRKSMIKINAVVAQLRQNGVDADFINEQAVYWLRTQYSHALSYAFLMKEQLPTLRDKFDYHCCLSRVIWYI